MRRVRESVAEGVCERLIGSIRRVQKSYFAYYHRLRTRLVLAEEVHEARAIDYGGEIVAISP
jgi:hypothetical protein